MILIETGIRFMEKVKVFVIYKINNIYKNIKIARSK